VPAQLRVIVTVRPKYACPACKGGVTQVKSPAHQIEGALSTEGAIAHVPPLGGASTACQAMDGYAGYNRLTKASRADGPLTLAYCWAHAPFRACKHVLPGSGRRLKEVFDRDGSEMAAEGLRRIAEFYKIEAEIRGAAPGQRLSARQIRSKPLADRLGLWLRDQCGGISAKSRRAEKLAYISRHWDGLQTFLIDGRVEIDSNPPSR